MNFSLKRLAHISVATSVLLFTLAATTWAVPLTGTAHSSVKGGVAAGQLPSLVRFREESGRGLLTRAWVNGSGPYTFAIDTGAGATILSARVAQEARVALSGKRSIKIGGLSNSGTVAGQEVSVRSLALGLQDNLLPAGGLTIVVDRLAPGIDGVLDPAEAYWPLGFEIDLPRGELTAFDPKVNPIRRNQNLSRDETIVPWLSDGQSRRPFVMLEGGVRALVDTGSGFGLAVTEQAAQTLGLLRGRGREYQDLRDLTGGQIAAHRISPSTVNLGGLVLRGVPTDLLPQARAGSPVLLGRDALRPFRLAFDPLNRLIRIIPG